MSKSIIYCRIFVPSKLDNLDEFRPIIKTCLAFEFLTAEEGQFLFENVPTAELMWVANELRKIQKPDGLVTWQIDRNVNTTNACIANCKFCNFFRPPGHEEVYVTTIEQYKPKIEETIRYGGDQLLLQGGHHPELGLDFYTNLFKELKELYPSIKDSNILRHSDIAPDRKKDPGEHFSLDRIK